MASAKRKLITDSPLVIYKASAGSGKTFTLTLYYLWLLFSKSRFEESLPSEKNKSYRHILAVTFTNKATGEMKARIIKSLYNLASGVEDGNSKIYADELIVTGCVKDYQELQERAREILYTLLHDYTNFNVSTIDTFFQKTMRAFVRDIGVQGGYNVELDSESMAKEAIDRMYLSLSDDGDNTTLRKWLLEYDIHQIEEGKKWNSAERQIRKLSSELFKEDYKRWRDNLTEEDLPTKKDIEEFSKYIKTQSSKIKEEWKKIVDEGHQILKDVKVDELHGMGSKTVLKYFISPTGKFVPPSSSLLNSERKDWGHKKNEVSDQTNAVLDAFERGGYVPKLKDFFEKKYPLYCMYNILQANLYSFGILSDVDSHLRDIIKERNVMLLSDTTDLLSKIINGTETPFIYEKTGINIHHYMIDEFQDTSHSQWKNFLPLLKESISKGGHNLIVGDVKQSIYRWRNSDWSMLNGLPSSEKYFEDSGAVSLSMEVNWRSTPNIIEFNNKFFSYAVKNLSSSKGEENCYLKDKVATAYSKNEQRPNDKKDRDTGYVKVSFVPQSDEYDNEILKKLYSDIQTMLKAGYGAENIAILTRWNREASMIAQYLMSEQKEGDAKFYVISNEALKIKNSPVVKSVLAIMRYINSPEDDINRLMMNYEVLNSSSPQEISVVEEAISRLREEKIFDNSRDKIAYLSTKSLYEMCEGIVDLINGRDNIDQIPYLQAFQDAILSYMGQNGSTLSQFLEWWDLNGVDLSISTPETDNAIRILTIHKSKGLEFPTIFLPFCDWDIEKGSDIIWKEPYIEGAEKWKFPLSVSKAMMQSPYADDYLEEKSLSIIDNLNVAYVAFTRAEDNLIIYAQESKDSALKSQHSFNAFMYNTLSLMIADKDNKAVFDGEDYELGSLYLPDKEIKHNDNVAEISRYDISPIGSKLRLKLKGESYFDERSNLSLGKIKHEMMSEIIIPDDVKRVAKKYERLGVINADEAENFVSEILSQIEADSKIGEWFAVGNKVLNESSVLNYSPDGKLSYRPDRVIINGDKVTVVDYKFGKESASYIKQVESYMLLLKKMGYFNVEGYIWYVTERKVV